MSYMYTTPTGPLPSFHAPTPSPNKLTAPDAGLLAARPLLPYSIRIGQDSSRTGKIKLLLLPSFHAPTPSPNKLTAPDAGLLAARPLLPYSIRIGQDSSRTGKIKYSYSRRSMRPLRRPTS